MKKYQSVIILALILLFCKEGKKENTSVTNSVISSDEIKGVQDESTKNNRYSDTLIIDRDKHKEILNILTLIPDNAMVSWNWKIDDRMKFVKDALRDGYIVDTVEQYMNIKALEPHYFFLQVVDGSWGFAIYEIDSNNKLIITDDMVGGNIFHAYKFANSKMTEVKMEDILPDVKAQFVKQSKEMNCDSLIEPEFELTLEYDLSQKNKIIVNSYNREGDEQSKCLNGNILEMTFNRSTEKFQVNSISWKIID